MSTGTTTHLRVLHVLPALGKEGQLGGAERVAVRLVNRLAELDHFNLRLCVLGARDPWYATYGLREEPLFLEQPDFHLSVSRFARAVWRLKKLLREWHPHIVHSHLWHADMVAAAAFERHSGHHVVHIHSATPLTEATSWRRLARRVIYRFLMRRSRARFIACAEAVKAAVVQKLRYSSDDIVVIWNGIEPEWVRGAPLDSSRPDRFEIGYAARLQRAKGQHVLIEALSKLTRKIPFARVLLAGEGIERAAYLERARRLGIEDRVVFLGRVREMRSFYDGLDVYACPSLDEGLPVSILEAMARRLPVVASRVGGIPEMIRDSEEGLLVPPNHPDKLADALFALFHNPALRAQMALRAQRRVEEHFLLSHMVSHVADFYRTLVPGRTA